jgi:hypothetical protein
VAEPGDWAVAARPREVVTATDARSSVTSTVPTRSVRYVRFETAPSRASVPAFGWPYVLSAPTDTTDTAG